MSQNCKLLLGKLVEKKCDCTCNNVNDDPHQVSKHILKNCFYINFFSSMNGMKKQNQKSVHNFLFFSFSSVKNVGSFKSLKKYAWNEINQSCAQKHCLNGNGTRIHHFSTTGSTNASGNQQGGGGTLTKGMTKSWKWRSVLSVFDWWILAAGGWVTWRGVLTRWTPLGICLIVAMQWRSRRKDGGADVKTASDFEVSRGKGIKQRV